MVPERSEEEAYGFDQETAQGGLQGNPVQSRRLLLLLKPERVSRTSSTLGRAVSS
ncbi:hypothetical protein F0562_028859 [Nyssa sinensis]|uniref:Uncharacterized protein n=1 Tax=Nyssa sinensis TaxID=561372 RepID=A0A5J5B5G0_9ASTE|nr:hypothetical protein F0562_028859 [Nyssa sinensis]